MEPEFCSRNRLRGTLGCGLRVWSAACEGAIYLSDSFIHSFIPYLLKDFSVIGTVLGTGD